MFQNLYENYNMKSLIEFISEARKLDLHEIIYSVASEYGCNIQPAKFSTVLNNYQTILEHAGLTDRQKKGFNEGKYCVIKYIDKNDTKDGYSSLTIISKDCSVEINHDNDIKVSNEKSNPDNVDVKGKWVYLVDTKEVQEALDESGINKQIKLIK